VSQCELVREKEQSLVKMWRAKKLRAETVVLLQEFQVRGANPFSWYTWFMEWRNCGITFRLSFGVRGATPCIYDYLFMWFMPWIWD